jgi:hypothetical protein
MNHWKGNTTYDFLVLTAVLYMDVRLASLVENLEWEVLDIGLNLSVIVFMTD